MLQVSAEVFELLVDQAVDALPDWVHERMDNVAILAAPYPSPQQRQAARLRPNTMLLGLYEGVPLTHRGQGYNLTPPDRITLFQMALQSLANTPAELIQLIRHTIIHEVGHHFGMSEAQLDELGM
jgi:predicted Zn-dependent protease with MMP-like domain